VISILIVGVGGALGAIARYGVTIGVGKIVSPSFPWGVLTANVLGSLLIGVLAGIGESRHIFTIEQRLFLFIGVLGGFTTFSSITNDTLALLRAENYLAALANVGLSFVLGMSAVAIGFVVGRAGG
jgi:CrcB protein